MNRSPCCSASGAPNARRSGGRRADCLQPGPGDPDAGGRDRDPPLPERRQRDLVALALGPEAVRDRDLGAVEDELGGRAGPDPHLLLVGPEPEARRPLLDEERGDGLRARRPDRASRRRGSGPPRGVRDPDLRARSGGRRSGASAAPDRVATNARIRSAPASLPPYGSVGRTRPAPRRPASPGASARAARPSPTSRPGTATGCGPRATPPSTCRPRRAPP